MKLHEFIFSDERSHRLTRHVCFWLAWLLFSSFVQLIPAAVDGSSLYIVITNYILKALARLPFQIIFCYYIVYILVPRYIVTRKFARAFVYLLASTTLLYWLTYFFLTPLFNLLSVRGGGKIFPAFINYFFSFYSNINFTGVLPACCFMLVIKYYKNWYVKQKEGQILLQENSKAELQLLKAQVHPHFLFNTLNNIYSYTLNGNMYAASLVEKLSGMIDYMCTDGYKALVPLRKEIQLLDDYIELEKVRYGSRLLLKKDIQGDIDDKYIAPLLMIPFVENCFKHGASKVRGNQWVEMFININNNQLSFTLANSKPDEEVVAETKKGIGLTNVKKRLQLLYPLHHVLKIESTNTTYLVYLQLQLSEKEIAAEDILSAPQQLIAYA